MRKTNTENVYLFIFNDVITLTYFDIYKQV